MICLLDTHLLLRAAYEPEKLSSAALAALEDENNALVFSAASMWEIGIKAALDRPDFTVDPNILRRGLLENGYTELSISSSHALIAAALPPIHRDPFDRMLLAQARVEGFALLTGDAKVAAYGAPARLLN